MRALMLGATGERRNLLERGIELCRGLVLAGHHDECIALAPSVIAREGGTTFGAMPVLWRRLTMAQTKKRPQRQAVDNAWRNSAAAPTAFNPAPADGVRSPAAAFARHSSAASLAGLVPGLFFGEGKVQFQHHAVGVVHKELVQANTWHLALARLCGIRPAGGRAGSSSLPH